MSSNTSQNFEGYLPVYDIVPEEWNDAQASIVEQFKRLSNAINVRDIGYYLDQEILTGKSFIPVSTSQTSDQFRSVFRKVIDMGSVTGGVPKSVPHGITFDNYFTLTQMYGAATNSGTLIAEPVPNGGDTLNMDATNVNISTALSYDRVYVTIEYMREI